MKLLSIVTDRRNDGRMQCSNVVQLVVIVTGMRRECIVYAAVVVQVCRRRHYHHQVTTQHVSRVDLHRKQPYRPPTADRPPPPAMHSEQTDKHQPAACEQ